MADGDQLASLIRALFVMRLVTVSFLPVLCFFKLITVVPHQNFNGQIYYWRNSRTLLILAIVASSAMFIWDYILTFRMEVDLVWKSKWNLIKGLYLLQRYLPFIDTIWLVLYRPFDAFSVFLCSLFRRSNGEKFDKDWMSKCNPRFCRFVKLSCPMYIATN